METSLHRELKALYAGADAQEVRLGPYRIDAVRDGELIEIQHASLAAIRDKAKALVQTERLRIVKPVVGAKRIVKLKKRGGRIASTRKSPKRGRMIDAFGELVHFTRVFPHERLTVELLLVDVEEIRAPGHGRRRRWRRDDHVVVDRLLLEVRERVTLSASADLWGLIPGKVPAPFDTRHLAEAADVPRWFAQQIAYCLHRCGATELVGKARNARLYRTAA